ncbi:hypothetical protein [Candidatus Phytoplasma melaleucae]|uniref:Uncharacterized protein n=1 Tax=Candidatus Phytoplasma melaleucae TaxID=2982630 RepID=A0ABT9DD81_9MOLU|nr:hypothetical protein ['Melaleuca sp.' phytoplasma]MDO8168030.1 hypothetical protein ['Melaleuca sp.' phytoplasma]
MARFSKFRRFRSVVVRTVGRRRLSLSRLILPIIGILGLILVLLAHKGYIYLPQ